MALPELCSASRWESGVSARRRITRVDLVLSVVMCSGHSSVCSSPSSYIRLSIVVNSSFRIQLMLDPDCASLSQYPFWYSLESSPLALLSFGITLFLGSESREAGLANPSLGAIGHPSP